MSPSLPRAAAVILAVCLSLQPGTAGVLALFETSVGRLDVELLPDDKPVTVENFIRYVQAGRYRDSIIHRLPVNNLTLKADFVAQGGGVYISNRGTTNSTFMSIPTFAPIANEFGTGSTLSNTYGTIAMAKVGGDTNSATSQWFFNLADNPFLDANNPDGLFVVFGRVIGATNTLETFKTFRLYTGAETSNVVAAWGPFPELPLLVPFLSESTLVYVDIRLLTLGIAARPDASREVSWTSVSNRTQHLEYRSADGGTWQTLLSTNGNGSIVRVVDAAPDPARLYRVRVDY